MEQLGVFKLVHRDSLNNINEKFEKTKNTYIKSFNTLQEMKDYITDYLNSIFKK